MAKSFTGHERAIIQAKLMEACEECWSRYGYKKTSVGEICAMAGISVGAFYLFYASKELLFVDTAKKVGERFFEMMVANLGDHPTKYDFANALKRMAAELKKVDWFLSLRHEFEMLARKLPPDFFTEKSVQALEDFTPVLARYQLKPTVPPEEAVNTLQVLMLLLLHGGESIGAYFDRSFTFIIDTTIEKLFE